MKYGKHDTGKAEHYRQMLEILEQMEQLAEKLVYLPEEQALKIDDSISFAKRWYTSQLRNLEKELITLLKQS